MGGSSLVCKRQHARHHAVFLDKVVLQCGGHMPKDSKQQGVVQYDMRIFQYCAQSRIFGYQIGQG